MRLFIKIKTGAWLAWMQCIVFDLQHLKLVLTICTFCLPGCTCWCWYQWTRRFASCYSVWLCYSAGNILLTRTLETSSFDSIHRVYICFSFATWINCCSCMEHLAIKDYPNLSYIHFTKISVSTSLRWACNFFVFLQGGHAFSNIL